MHGLHNGKGVKHEDLRERLRELGLKARRDPKSLTLCELDEICALADKLKPSHSSDSGAFEVDGD